MDVDRAPAHRAADVTATPDRPPKSDDGGGFTQHPRRQVALSMTCLGLVMFLGALSQTIVATALPRIVADLGGFDRYTWVATAYMVAATVAAPIAGGLSDTCGRKPFFVLGLAIFIVASFLLGISGPMNEIIAFRGVQGIGGGFIMTCSMVAVSDLFPPEERGKGQGLLVGVFGIALGVRKADLLPSSLDTALPGALDDAFAVLVVVTWESPRGLRPTAFPSPPAHLGLGHARKRMLQRSRSHARHVLFANTLYWYALERYLEASRRQRLVRAAGHGLTAGRTDVLTIAEEVLLLILDTEKGEIRSSLPAHSREIVMAGAVLMDLSLENRIDTDLERLVVIDPAPLGDDLLDPILSDIVGETAVHDTAWWLARTAGLGEEIRRKAIDRLVGHGILEAETNGLVFLSRLVSRARRYPTVGGKTTEDVQFRIMRTIYSDDIPGPRDLVVIGLASACGVFESILSREELAGVRERIDQIARLDMIGREVAAAVRRVEPPAPVVTAARSWEEIPHASGWPLAGNAFDLAGDLREFLTREYRKHGPIFRIRAFNRRFIAFAGPEAMVFLTKIAHTHLRSYEFWRDFDFAAGASHLITSMDGPAHLRMRKLQARAYSPKFIEARLDAFVDITRRAVAEWPRGRPMVVQRALQRIIAEQMGLTLTGISPRDHLDDLVVFLETLLKIHVFHQWPKLMEHRPRFRRARRRMGELYAELVDAHRPEKRRDESPDFIDDLLEMNRDDPQFLPETDHLMTFFGPYLAGLDTAASACSYMLHALSQHPDLLERMRAEVDGVFEHGTPTAEDLGGLDVTHRIALETLRVYTIAPAMTRMVSNSFEFGGYRVPAGMKILIGITVGHRLPECFPDPGRFDIERYRRNPPEHRRPGAFAPFGLGRHRCLGSGFAEVQIALTMATIVREVDFALARPDRPLRIKHTPLAHPDASFRILVKDRRAAEAVASAS